MIDDELPEDEQQLPDQQEFREELEDGAQRDEQEMAQSPNIELPDQIGEMSDMGADAAAEQELDQPPPQVPEEAQEPAPAADDGPEPPPLADLAEMGDAATAEAKLDSSEPPVTKALEDFRAMGDVAAKEVPPPKTEAEQIKATEQLRDMDLFEFDAGSFEADQTGMDFTQAESSYREVNYQWQRLMTAMVIDHQHRLEQLLAMLERER